MTSLIHNREGARVRYIIAVFMAVTAVAVAGCGVGPDKSREDAKDVSGACTPGQAESCVDKTPPQVIAFNNHYPNVETKCDGHGHRVFASTDEHGNGLTIYPDPSCPGYVRGEEPVVIISAGR
jgi:hypothetical protein